VHYLVCIASCVRPSVFVRPFFFYGTEQSKKDRAGKSEKKRYTDRN